MVNEIRWWETEKEEIFFCLSCKMNACNFDKTYRGKMKTMYSWIGTVHIIKKGVMYQE